MGMAATADTMYQDRRNDVSFTVAFDVHRAVAAAASLSYAVHAIWIHVNVKLCALNYADNVAKIKKEKIICVYIQATSRAHTVWGL